MCFFCNDPYWQQLRGGGRFQMKDRSHDDAMVEYFLSNPGYAAALLAETFSDACEAEKAILWRQIMAAFGSDGDDSVSLDT